jgi:predicted nucleic acid-binding protein
MTAFVLDCSIVMSWCFEDEASPDTDALLDRVRDEGALVPTLWFWEVANTLRSAVRRGRLAPGDVSGCLRLLSGLPIEADPDGAARAWRETLMLSQSHALTAYDAAYLELALRHGADLATLDQDLRIAAEGLSLKVVPGPPL